MAAVATPRVVSPLEVQEMLDDPLFQAAVEGIAESMESSLGEPLSTGLSARSRYATDRASADGEGKRGGQRPREKEGRRCHRLDVVVRLERYLELPHSSPAVDPSSENAP